MLIFPLKKEWYEKIKSGEKTIEYREVKPYWKKRIDTLLRDFVLCESDLKVLDDFRFGKTVVCNKGCILQLGYNANTRLKAIITKIEVVDGKNTDLHIDKPVYAIHLADVR